MTGGGQHLVGPQRDRAIAGPAGEANTFVRQPRAKPAPARHRIDQQQAEPRDGVGILDQKHRADVPAIHFGDPAALACRIVFGGEVGNDLRAHALEVLCPAIFPGVEFGVPGNHPAEIAGPWLAELDRARRCRP